MAASPTAMLICAFITYYTATLLAECYYDTVDPGYCTYMVDAVRSYLGGAQVMFCGVIYVWLVGVTSGYGAQMPRKGTSGKCIGRAKAAPAAGCSHGIRAGDHSLSSHRCDWFRIMGSTIINTDGSCVISAAIMCIEAQYRRLSGKYHGATSCFLKVTTEAVESLKDMCKERGVWEPMVGAPTVEGVLDVMVSWKKGMPTVLHNISLRLKSYATFKAEELSQVKVTSMIQKKGPVIGALYVDDVAYYSSTVYRGDRACPANHAVVCTGHRYINGELCIIIMDNEERGGPLRFILLEAFEQFHVLTVDASYHNKLKMFFDRWFW